MLNKICLYKSDSNYYYYDCINQCLEQCDELFYLLLNYCITKRIRDFDEQILNQFILDKVNKYSYDDIQISFVHLKWLFENIQDTPSVSTFPNWEKEEILYSLAQAKQIILEMTEKCNLYCTYCCYGKLYEKKKYRNGRCAKECNSSLSYIRNIFKLKEKLLGLGSAVWPELFISFYGGEPLLKIQEIQDIVHFISNTPSCSNVTYNMTTNGVLLDKAIDFLVENNFVISVSLDGNQEHNGYRVYKNGKESFLKVEQNLLLIRDKYPLYFEKNISFLSVLHNKNKIFNSCEYFSNKFNKIPQFLPMAKDGVKKGMEEKFNYISYNYVTNDELEKLNCYFPETLEIYNKNVILKSFCGVDTNRLTSILSNHHLVYPTGTCRLFQQKVFVTIDGLLFPCEKMSRNYCFGRISNDGIEIYSDKINNYYKCISDYHSSSKFCLTCYKKERCNQCFFMDGDEIKRGKCFYTLADIKTDIKGVIDAMEENI